MRLVVSRPSNPLGSHRDVNALSRSTQAYTRRVQTVLVALAEAPANLTQKEYLCCVKGAAETAHTRMQQRCAKTKQEEKVSKKRKLTSDDEEESTVKGKKRASKHTPKPKQQEVVSKKCKQDALANLAATRDLLSFSPPPLSLSLSSDLSLPCAES